MATGDHFTHYIRFRSINLPETYCNVCHTDKANISFNYNQEIFIICRPCTFEFLRLTFNQVYSYTFLKEDGERTNVVYTFFREYVFRQEFTIDSKVEEKFNFFQHPFASAIKKLPLEKRLPFLDNIASNYLR